MRRPFFIVGPTAVGKSEIAVAVAERCGGEIVNADAFQVYAGLDLLTAKPALADRQRAPHHLIGTVPLTATYNVARYREDAEQCLVGVAWRERPAIVVGGSGLYVKALTHGLSPLPPAQPALRIDLEALDAEVLLTRLRALDPPSAAVIDVKNKRRLVRAVEVCVVTGRRFSDFRDLWDSPSVPETTTGVCLTRDKDELAARIDRRVEYMFAHDVVEEVRAVPPENLSETASRMIGWHEVRGYLSGQVDLPTCAQQIVAATRQYAKRQMTWFRRENVFVKVPLSAKDEPEHIVDVICAHLQKQNANL